MNVKRGSPLPIHSRIINKITPNSSPAKTSLKSKKNDYDESKNPFANDDDEEDDDATNPFKNDCDDDDYNKNI